MSIDEKEVQLIASHGQKWVKKLRSEDKMDVDWLKQIIDLFRSNTKGDVQAQTGFLEELIAEESEKFPGRLIRH